MVSQNTVCGQIELDLTFKCYSSVYFGDFTCGCPLRYSNFKKLRTIVI